MDLGRSLAALSLTAALLAGCAGDAAVPPARTEAGTPSRMESGEAPEERTEVSFWFAANDTGAAVMRDIVEGFERGQDQWHVRTKVFGSYTEIYSAVQAAVATGTAPDVVVLERDTSLELDAKGLTVDLTQIPREYAVGDPERFLSVYFDQGLSEGGRIFAMPFYGTTQVLYYNKAAFAAAGIDPEGIATWEDLADAASRIQDAGICRYGWEPMWGYENMLDAVFSNGGTVFSEDGRTVTIGTDEWVEVWEAFRRWIHEDRIMRIHSGGYGWEYWTYTMEDALDGTAGGYTGSSGDQADVDLETVGMLEQPAWDGEGQALPEAKALLLNVLTTSGEEERMGAFALVRYLIDVPAQVRWTVGTGYIAVNQGVLEDEGYQAYLEGHPYAGIPLAQSAHASVYPYDPTGGAVREALVRAADRVQIEGLPAGEVLEDARRTAQKALDAALTAQEDGEAAR